MKILSTLNTQLVKVLSQTLPTISLDWWQSLVLEKLTFQQQTYAKNLPIAALEQLDLAALLRVTDQNWYDLSQKLNFSKDVRNWLKEAQTIRNRWAHAPAGGLPDEVYYRDLDTLARLMQAFGADNGILETINQEKKHLLRKLADAESKSEPSKTETSSPERFQLGTVVRLKADPNKTGAIINVLTGGDTETRYQVFHDGATATYYESQLEALNSTPPRAAVSPDALHAALTALQLRHPSTTHLYSLFASRINFVPYQFRPVLKLIQADRPRMLIADEVGVGKTIEAGLILKELQARRELRTVLVICPKPLVAERKWQQEMKRFTSRLAAC